MPPIEQARFTWYREGLFVILCFEQGDKLWKFALPVSHLNAFIAEYNLDREQFDREVPNQTANA